MATYPMPLQYAPARWSLDIEETGDEPVSLTELKTQLRIGFSDDDASLNMYLTAARQIVESMTNRAIITQTRTLTASDFPDGDNQFLELPGGNVLAVSSVAYVDPDGASQTFTGYTLDAGTAQGTARLSLAVGSAWPDVQDRALPVTVTYSAGYDPSASPAVPVPERLKVGIMMVASDLYERREANVSMKAGSYQPNAMLVQLVKPMRIWRAV